MAIGAVMFVVRFGYFLVVELGDCICKLFGYPDSMERFEKRLKKKYAPVLVRSVRPVVSTPENNPPLVKRVLSALKAGSLSALEQLLSRPVASFVIGALKDWQKTK